MMTFEMLRQSIKGLPLKCVRNDYEDFLECVIHEKDLTRLNAMLESFYGPPVKTANQKSSPENDRLCALHGGIRENQVLYVKKIETILSLAMLWPWCDCPLITVKLYHKPEDMLDSD